MGSRPIFCKALKFPIYPCFCRLDRIIFGRLKKKQENFEKSEIILSALRLDSGKKNAHCQKGLKFPCLFVFLRLDQIILNPFKKIKKIIENPKIIFSPHGA